MYTTHKINRQFTTVKLIFLMGFGISNIPVVRLDCVPLSPRQGIDVVCTLPRKYPQAHAQPQSASAASTDSTIDCNTLYSPEGTIARYSCSKYYIALKTIEQLPNELICRNNTSKWSGLELFRSFTCEIDCGKSADSDITTFIIKGNKTEPNSWPWHASIYKMSDQFQNDSSEFTSYSTANHSSSVVLSSVSTNYHCGGTLVHAFHMGFVILTAAHCFLEDFFPFTLENAHLFQVVLGGESSFMNENLVNPNAQIFSVEQIFVHQSYTPADDTHQNDIALLKLYEPVVLSQWVRPACLSSNQKLVDKSLKTGSTGEVIGFGRRDETHTPSPTLVHATIPVVDKLECYEHLNRDLDPGQICAGYLSEKTSVCSGDSGGGLVFPTNIQGSTRYFIQGIVSYGYKTCEKYAVFTKVVHHMDWLRLGCESIFEQQQENQLSDATIGEITTNEASTISSISQPSCPVAPVTERPQNSNCDCPEIPDSSESESYRNTNRTRPLSLPPVAQEVEIEEYQDYQSIGLAMHNHYRFLHGSPPLELNHFLNEEAKHYAARLIHANTFVNLNEHSSPLTSPLNYIKNIFELKEFNKARPSQPSQAVRQAIKHWYDATDTYNWYSPTTSTFSQIVWKSTKEIGVGYAVSTLPSSNPNPNGIVGNSNYRTVVVVAYSPPGNTIGTDFHRSNVFPRNS